MLQIVEPETSEQLGWTGALLHEYGEALGLPQCAANIAQEIAALPGEYGPPGGCLLLALCDGVPAGCVGLRKLSDDTCEMKRLYVRPAHRGQGLGRNLAEHFIGVAARLGYARIRLDTIAEQMPQATALYRALGFVDIEAYGRHQPECTHFMELRIAKL